MRVYTLVDICATARATKHATSHHCSTSYSTRDNTHATPHPRQSKPDVLSFLFFSSHLHVKDEAVERGGAGDTDNDFKDTAHHYEYALGLRDDNDRDDHQDESGEKNIGVKRRVLLLAEVELRGRRKDEG